MRVATITQADGAGATSPMDMAEMTDQGCNRGKEGIPANGDENCALACALACPGGLYTTPKLLSSNFIFIGPAQYTPPAINVATLALVQLDPPPPRL